LSGSEQVAGGNLTIRPATEDDVEFIFAMIVELAEYERARESVRGTPAMLRDALFGEHPVAEAVIAERAGERLGSAVFHVTFSTWECLPGLWLEDLYVRPQHRQGGVGEALFRHLAAVAVERGYSRYGWVALDWNEPALKFYAKHGATVLGEWLIHRLSDEELRRLAAGA
jgi:GNAT superfamily N-acetyltransferase